MTTRYLTTDQNGNGDQTYWDINGYFLHGPSGEKLNLGGGNTTVTASNEIVQIGTSYLRIPQGVSNERPDISNSYIGMMRYLTTENLLEYFNGQTNTWVPISLPSPTISSISPNYINFDTSGGETNTNTYTLTGSNFNIAPGGISVEVIGNNGTGTILIPNFNNASSESSATFTFDPSGTEQLIGISNELPFAVKLTNTNSGFSSILNNAIIATNAGPEFTQPSVFTPFSFQTFAVQDPCANFIVAGEDLSSPKHYPLDFSFVSGTAGGFNVGGGDISSISDFSSIVQVPTGNRLSETAGSYNFKMRVTDALFAFSDANYTLSLANPTITSIDPSYISINDVVDINITGNYFIRDSDISFNKGSNTLTQTEVSYNSITSLTVKDVSAGEVGVYDISLANGSVIVNVPSVVLNIVSPFIDATGGDVSGTYIDGGITYKYHIFKTIGSSSFIVNSVNSGGPSIYKEVEYLVIAGGGSGGTADDGGGGGGAGGYRSSVSGQSSGGGALAETPITVTATSYTVTVGDGGNGVLGSPGTGQGNSGSNSVFDSITSLGGGGGGGVLGSSAGSGGSGGGGGQRNSAPGGAGQTGQGYAGGNVSSGTNDAGAGGGGAGQVGTNTSSDNAGNGGIGTTTTIITTGIATTNSVGIVSGSDVYFAGGGGGAGLSSSGNGGIGGGGNGAPNGSAGGIAGVVNTGGGGGGSNSHSQLSGKGGSGIVILRYRYSI